jgi:hypothetical protein
VPNSPDAVEAAARLARMKRLVDDLERVCSENADQRDTIATLRREMEAARLALTTP